MPLRAQGSGRRRDEKCPPGASAGIGPAASGAEHGAGMKTSTSSRSQESIATVRPALEALIHEGNQTRAICILGLQPESLQAGGLDQIVHLAVEMTATRNVPPERRQPLLPASDGRVRRQAMLDEPLGSAWLQHAAYLAQSGERVGTRAQRPGHHHDINGAILRRDGTGRGLDKMGPHPRCRAIDRSGLEGSRPTTISMRSPYSSRFSAEPDADLEDPVRICGDKMEIEPPVFAPIVNAG